MKNAKKLLSALMIIVTLISLLSVFPIGAASDFSDQIPSDGWYSPVPYGCTVTSPFTLHSNTLINLRSSPNIDGKHGGVDFANGGKSFDVYCVRDGEVVEVVNEGKQNGTCCLVVVKHTIGKLTVYSRYLHFESGSIAVKKGKITAGTFIGRAGKTGHSTGIHLHFELSLKSNSSKKLSEKADVNPIPGTAGFKYSAKYSTASAKSEIERHAFINYTFDLNAARAIASYQSSETAVNKIYTVKNPGTGRVLPIEKSGKSLSVTASEYVIIISRGVNHYNNNWYLVRKPGQDEAFYIYESYINKDPVKSLPSPEVKSVSRGSAKSVDIKMKRAAAKGSVYLATFTQGSKKITAKFTSAYKNNIKLSAAGYWNVSIRIIIDDNTVSMKGPEYKTRIYVR